MNEFRLKIPKSLISLLVSTFIKKNPGIQEKSKTSRNPQINPIRLSEME